MSDFADVYRYAGPVFSSEMDRYALGYVQNAIGTLVSDVIPGEPVITKVYVVTYIF